MDKWIEINLPWYSFSLKDAPQQPDLTHKIQKEFPDYLSNAMRKQWIVEKRIELSTRVQEWWTLQPEIIAWRKAYQEWEKEEKAKSFVGLGLNQPGTLIVVDIFGEEKILLIGDINTNAGISDEGKFDNNTVVRRYRILDHFKCLKLLDF